MWKRTFWESNISGANHQTHLKVCICHSHSSLIYGAHYFNWKQSFQVTGFLSLCCTTVTTYFLLPTAKIPTCICSFPFTFSSVETILRSYLRNGIVFSVFLIFVDWSNSGTFREVCIGQTHVLWRYSCIGNEKEKIEIRSSYLSHQKDTAAWQMAGQNGAKRPIGISDAVSNLWNHLFLAVSLESFSVEQFWASHSLTLTFPSAFSRWR